MQEIKATILAEVRADLGVTAGAIAWRRLYALRSRVGGGTSELPAVARARLLTDAANVFELVELEELDLTHSLLARISAEQRVLMLRVRSDEDDARTRKRLERLFAVPARYYHVVYEARTHAETLRPLRLLRELDRNDVVAYSEGTIGMWTRVVAPHLGSPAVIGTIDGDIATHGAPSVGRLIDDYGFPSVRPVSELFAIAGDPIFSSLSPRLHNAAFRELGRAALYVPFHVQAFDEFWSGVVADGPTDAFGLPLRAMCVVSPHKAIALGAASSATAIVERTRSTNFFVREASGWIADTTDAAGLLLALDDYGIDATTLKAAVVGCGGSGRTIAAALHQAGADVTLVNRGFDRASLAIRLLQLPFRPLAGFSPAGYSMIVNATPVGGRGEPPPFAVSELDEHAVIVDLVYGDSPTPLVAATRGKGRVVIDGKDILVKQAMRQFLLMTGQEMPPDIVHRVLGPVAIRVGSEERERERRQWTMS